MAAPVAQPKTHVFRLILIFLLGVAGLATFAVTLIIGAGVMKWDGFTAQLSAA